MSPFDEIRTLGALAAGVVLGGALMYKFVTGAGSEPKEEEQEPTPKKTKKEKRKSKTAQAKTPQPFDKDEADWVDDEEGKTTTPTAPVARTEVAPAVSEEASVEGAKKKKKPKKKAAAEEETGSPATASAPASAPAAAAANPPPPTAAKAKSQERALPPPVEESAGDEGEFVVVSSKKKKTKQPPAATPAPVPSSVPAPAATQPAATPTPQPSTPAPAVTTTPKSAPAPTTTAPPAAPATNGTDETEEKKKKKKKKKPAAKPQETVVAPEPAPYVPVPEPPVKQEDDEWETVVSKSTQRAKRAEANMQSKPVDSDDDNALVKEVVVKLGENVGAVMGRGGTTIRSIQESSRATCRIDKTKAEAVVVGPTECVNKALALIQAIMDEQKARIDATRVVEIDVSENIGAVMGKGGENLRRIAQLSGAKIDLNKEKKSLTVIGLENQVLIVQAEVHKALNPPPPEAKITLDNINQRTQYMIVGKGGATIRQLQDQTGAKILVDRASQSVTLSGTSAQVLTAHQAVNQLILDHNYFVVMELSPADAGLVVGAGGETIHRLQAETDAYLDLEREAAATVLRISGLQASVDKAKAMVDRLLTEPPPPPKLAKGEELREIDLGEAVGSVIGTQGATIIKIQEISGAQVNIIRGRTLCRVHGPKDSVASAVAEIEKIVARQREIAEKTRRVSELKAQQEATPAPVASEDIQAAWGEGGQWGGGEADGVW